MGLFDGFKLKKKKAPGKVLKLGFEKLPEESVERFLKTIPDHMVSNKMTENNLSRIEVGAIGCQMHELFSYPKPEPKLIAAGMNVLFKLHREGELVIEHIKSKAGAPYITFYTKNIDEKEVLDKIHKVYKNNF